MALKIEALQAECEKLRKDAETEQQPADHPAITHCDNCGCDWLDNGLNPIGCPYCKHPAPDVSALVEALEQCITSMLDSGYRADAVVIRAARSALAVHRKQGGEV